MSDNQVEMDAEFDRMVNTEANPLEYAEPADVVSAVQEALGRHAKEFLARYGQDQFAPGKALPPAATMEVRGLIAVMLMGSENLNIATGKLRPRHPRR